MWLWKRPRSLTVTPPPGTGSSTRPLDEKFRAATVGATAVTAAGGSVNLPVVGSRYATNPLAVFAVLAVFDVPDSALSEGEGEVQEVPNATTIETQTCRRLLQLLGMRSIAIRLSRDGYASSERQSMG
jgi:hypothetical protein